MCYSFAQNKKMQIVVLWTQALSLIEKFKNICFYTVYFRLFAKDIWDISISIIISDWSTEPESSF